MMPDGAVRAPIRLVFLGCGAATAMHARTLRRFEGVRRHYASRDPARAESFARRLGGAGHFRGYEAALDDPGIDVALVAVPPALHLELVLAALDRGKHVIVEKPAFLSVAELDRAAERARAADRQIFVAENYAYKPLTGALRRVVESGALGEIRFVRVNALKRQRTGDWRDDPALAGGGALFEGGVHWLSLLAGIGLHPTHARAFPAGAHDEARRRNALVVVEYAEGAVGTLAYSWDIASPLRGLRVSRIHGTRGSAVFESNGLFLATGPRPLSFRVPGPRDLRGFRAMFADFFTALAAGRAPHYSLASARRDLALMDALHPLTGMRPAAGREPASWPGSPAGAPADRGPGGRE